MISCQENQRQKAEEIILEQPENSNIFKTF